MTTELMKTERSRRGLLAAAAAAVAGAAAASVARVVPVKGADGDPVTVGGTFEGESATHFQTTSTYAIHGESVDSRGVQGTSTTGQGVHGDSVESAGVAGRSESGNGMHGTSTSNRGVWGQSTSGQGVVGESSSANGVVGNSVGAAGVVGSGTVGVQASGSTGLKTSSNSGYAIHSTSGKVRLDGISGTAVIEGGETEVVVKPSIDVTNDTFVLLSPSANLGPRALWYILNKDANTFTIKIDKPRQNNARIGYLVLERAG